MGLKKILSIKKCPECGGSTEKIGDATADFHPDNGGPVQELKWKVYKCKKCSKTFCA